jgi:hypothetical protein
MRLVGHYRGWTTILSAAFAFRIPELVNVYETSRRDGAIWIRKARTMGAKINCAPNLAKCFVIDKIDKIDSLLILSTQSQFIADVGRAIEVCRVVNSVKMMATISDPRARPNLSVHSIRHRLFKPVKPNFFLSSFFACD